ETKIVEMNVSLGKEFIIDVVSNPFTGYRWEIKFDESFIKLKERIYQPYNKEIVEEGGKEEFIFIPIKTGETNITMRYCISFDYDIVLEKIYQIKINSSMIQ
ncbi:MAG: protease inhibitor I42 family protein, partial [Candidatus Altarchaeaceae archaeon]